MLTLFVVDKSAEARTRLVEKINAFLQSDISLLSFLPQISVKPLSLEELKFHAAPDLCILGDELLNDDIFEIGKIRKQIPSATLLIWLSSEVQDFSVIEQLAGMGVDDTLNANLTPLEFAKKLVLIAGRKKNVKHHSKMIVVTSGKGGVGTTSIAAALGEGLATNGYSTLVVDFDCETQDLSRFLQARPFLNENLQGIFDRTKAITKESIEECLVQIWEEEKRFKCMTPILENEALYDPNASYSRTLLSVLEVLDGIFDFVVIDSAAVKGNILRTLIRVADELIFVINNDPAALYAGVNRLVQYRSWLSAEASLTLVENAPLRKGLASTFLRREFQDAAQLGMDHTFISIPHCHAGSRWPASGGTLYSTSSSRTIKALRTLVDRMIPPELKQERAGFLPALQTIIRRSNVRLAEPSVASEKKKVIEISELRKDLKALPAPLLQITEKEKEEIEIVPAADSDIRSLVSGAQLFSN
ncbi:MAG: AAA family ATPase [Bdellovibrionota bacterium]